MILLLYVDDGLRFVANVAGEVVGVVCIKDLVKTLLDMEKRQQANRQSL